MTIIGLILLGVFVLMVMIRTIGTIIELFWRVAGAVSQIVLFLIIVFIIVPLIAF
jgi:hypothetical protein